MDDGLLRMLRVIKKDLKPARHQNKEDEDDEDEDDLLGVEEAEDSDQAETGETANSLCSGCCLCSRSICMKIQASLVEDTCSCIKFAGKPQAVTVFSNLAQAFSNPQIWGIIQKKIFKAKEYPRGDSEHLTVLEPLLERYLKLAAKPFERKKMCIQSVEKQTVGLLEPAQNDKFARSEFHILDLKNNLTRETLLSLNCKRFTAYSRMPWWPSLTAKNLKFKCEFLKEIFRRRPWIGSQLLGFLLEKCSCASPNFGKSRPSIC